MNKVGKGPLRPLAEVEAFLEQVGEVLDGLDTIEVPRIRLD
jgi:hypothetical protein